MRWFVLLVGLVCLMASPGRADTCPPPFEFADRKAALLETLQNTRDANAGRFLSRELLSLLATAPNRKAQTMLDQGMAWRRTGEFDAALEVLDALVAYCPDYAEGYTQRAYVYLLQEDYTAALGNLDAALDRVPDHPGAMAGKAVTLRELGRAEEAQGLISNALSLNPWLSNQRLFARAPPGEPA